MTRHALHSRTYIGLNVAVIATVALQPFGVFSSTVWAAPAPTTAQAQKAANETAQALEIAPPIITLKADPGQTLTTQINIRDISSGNLQVTGEVNDFVAAGEDGTPKVLLNTNENDPYSIRTWVQPLTTINLTPKDIKTLPVTIKVPADAAPGGHYGVIRFSAKAPDLDASGVSLSASLGTLIFITVSGNATEKLDIKEFKISKAVDGAARSFFETAPLQFTQRITNSGNIHEQPTGNIKITDMFGRSVTRINVNMPPRNILPNSTRKFTQELGKSNIGNRRLFGKYTASMELTYGNNRQKLQAVKTFWVIPYKLIAFFLFVLLFGFLGFRTLIRQYNRIVIERAEKRMQNRK
jgi:hypothetical protein